MVLTPILVHKARNSWNRGRQGPRALTPTTRIGKDTKLVMKTIAAITVPRT